MRTWPALDVTSASTAGLDGDLLEWLQAALIDFAVAAIDERHLDHWRVFFQTGDDRNSAAEALPPLFPGLVFAPADVEDEDWAARSQAGQRAIRVGRIVVAPPWDIPSSDQAQAGTEVVVIQPSMGFGTGHHATTRLCLGALQQAPLDQQAVLDIGTGSGVLAIASSRLGAGPVLGIDDDPDAIANADENLTLNPGAVVTFRVADFRQAMLPVSDVVVANLTGGLLSLAAATLQRLVSPTGRLILSGLLQEEEATVRAAYASFRVRDRVQEDEWIGLVLQREAAFR